MPTPNKNPVLMQAVKLDYISGMSLREVSAKYKGKVSYRTINKASIKEDWLGQRKVIQCNSKTTNLVVNSNQALEVIQAKSNEQSRDMATLMASLQELAHRASDALSSQSFESLDVRDLGVMLKLLVDGVEKLQSIGLKGGGGSLPTVAVSISLGDDDDKANDSSVQGDNLADRLTQVVEQYSDSTDTDLLLALRGLLD